MCRLFALRANQPTKVSESLLHSPYSLRRQSCGDRGGTCHSDGWGIGYYSEGRSYLTRAACPAEDDRQFAALAESILAPTVLAHVRQASVGAVAERNTHPFRHGSWMFAHNGTLQGFAQEPERLRRLIPPHLRQSILGDTDSEHLFYFLLGRLEETGESAERTGSPTLIAQVLADSLGLLAKLFPGEGDKKSQMNVVLTNSCILVASRWGHPLYWLERRGCTSATEDRPVQEAPNYRALVLASEPTTMESGWTELPDRSILAIHPDLTPALTLLHG